MPKYIVLLGEEEERNFSELPEEPVSKEEEFEIDSEARLVGYFIKNLHKAKYQPSPINLRQFYFDKAVETLSQIKDQTNRENLERLIRQHSSKTKH